MFSTRYGPGRVAGWPCKRPDPAGESEVPSQAEPNPVREFGCWTRDLIAMAEWFRACRVGTVAIQSTGVYSIPL
jgi:hypothetical protein